MFNTLIDLNFLTCEFINTKPLQSASQWQSTIMSFLYYSPSGVSIQPWPCQAYWCLSSHSISLIIFRNKILPQQRGDFTATSLWLHWDSTTSALLLSDPGYQIVPFHAFLCLSIPFRARLCPSGTSALLHRCIFVPAPERRLVINH